MEETEEDHGSFTEEEVKIDQEGERSRLQDGLGMQVGNL